MTSKEDLEKDGLMGFSDEDEEEWEDRTEREPLVEADIPQEIARDNEVTEAICKHRSVDHADVQLHADKHVTGGNDVIANVIAAGNAGLMTGADKTKLNGIEASATDDQTEGEILNLLGLTSAEVETLTDNSMADALHRHSELSASDGSPDAVVYVDSGGVLYADYAYGIGLDVLHSANIGDSLIVGDNLTVDGQVAVGTGIDATAALRAEAPAGQSTIRTGVKGVASSVYTNNYGVQGIAVGGNPAVNNYGVYGHAQYATTLNYHFLASTGAYCTNDWYPSSMRKYKSDVLEFKDLDINGLYDDLDAVKPVKFRYKKIVSAEMDEKTGEMLVECEENPDAPYIYGFLADDPDVSDFLRDVDRQSWSPSSASAYALLCIKQQKQIIQGQQIQIEDFTRRIIQLEGA